ncbi:MAG: serine--tRNA ligase [Candidatus Subteraquimicrobiales bacterium]|nr:serine--tRNA ligase [Candidatus Subteraquimicrobiales bacterium]
MLDVKFVRENLKAIENALKNRSTLVDLEEFKALDKKRRDLLVEVESKKALRNTVSEEIAQLKKERQEATEKIEATRALSDEIRALDTKVSEVEEALKSFMLNLPNLPHSSVPVGKEEQHNKVVRVFGKVPEFGFKPLAHWDIGTNLDILDFERGVKIAESRFTKLKGWGAKLERVLINFMLDLHTKEHSYTEVFPPILVNSASMMGTGQLPKFAAELYKCTDDDLYLIPTAEVSVTNIFRDEILSEDDLPIKYTAYTPCFRREAGAAGKETRGIIRQHQFNKVELVKFTKPEESYEELEKLTNDAEEVLKKMGLHYRVVALCTGDLGFSASKTYDLEVWMPSYNAYKEVSSCSNFEGFQARRANIRYRTKEKKVRFVHTLNGSGLAIGRTLAAILENYQQKDGSIIVPEILRPYMDGVEKIE